MREFSDDDIEAALAGSGDGPVTPAVADLRLAFRLPPDELTTARHIAAMCESTRPARRPSRLGLIAAAAAVAALVLVGALGSAGALPDPMQALVSDVAGRFGVNLPSGETDSSPGTDVPSSTSVPVETQPSVPATPAPAGPGESENAPGQDPAGPGQSENAPGHDPGGPGQSEDAPGHDPGGPGQSEDAPGQGPTRGGGG